MTLYILTALLGLVAGVLSGLFGIGGGIVMVPVLLLLGIDLLDANAISLAAMLLPVGMLGVMAYYKAGFIHIKSSLWISVGLMLGSFVGAKIAITISEKLLGTLYTLYLLYICFLYLGVQSYLVRTLSGRQKAPVANSANTNTPVYQGRAPYIGIGGIGGVIAGMFGKGGGLVLVPMLTKFFRYDAKSATATSLFAMQLPVGIPSVWLYAEGNHLNTPNYQYAIIIAIGIVFGTFAGGHMAIKMPSSIFKKVYAFFLLFVCAYMIAKLFFNV